MDNFFNNGPKFNCESSYISYINIHLEKNCWFENWIFKNFFLDIYKSSGLYKTILISLIVQKLSFVEC